MGGAMIDFVCGGCHRKSGAAVTPELLMAGKVKCSRCGRPVPPGAAEEMARMLEGVGRPVSAMTPKELGLSPGQIRAAESQRMLFGKYRGKTLGAIVAEDPAYLDWLNGVDLTNPSLRSAVAVLCDVHAQAIERAIEDRER